MNSEKVEWVVEALIADSDRLDGALTLAHINRLLAKRQMTVNEGAEVYRCLYEKGVEIVTTDATGSAVRAQRSDRPSYPRADSQHHSKVLTHEQEMNLGRLLDLGRRAQRELDEGVELTRLHQNWLSQAEKARHEMIEANRGLVGAVSNLYVGLSSLEYDDLCQEGLIGLLAAVEKYDHTLGYKFSTYATYWIRQAISRAIPDRGAMIRLPVHMHEAVARLSRATRMLWSNASGQYVYVQQLADELNWSPEKVHFVQQISKLKPVSISVPLGGENEGTLEDLLPSNLPCPRAVFSEIERADTIADVLRDLKEQERTVIRKRYGIENDGREETLEEVGRQLNLTRERIRQIQEKALTRLRGPQLSSRLREIE